MYMYIWRIQGPLEPTQSMNCPQICNSKQGRMEPMQSINSKTNAIVNKVEWNLRNPSIVQ